MKRAYSILAVVFLSCLAAAQEPLNSAVQQPSVSQPMVSQPSATQPGDPTLPSVYEPFAFQPMTGLPHQICQRNVVQVEAELPQQPVVKAVRQPVAQEIPAGNAP